MYSIEQLTELLNSLIDDINGYQKEILSLPQSIENGIAFQQNLGRLSAYRKLLRYFTSKKEQ